MKGRINGKVCRILLDSGASVCVTSKKMIERCQYSRGRCLIGPSGEKLSSLGVARCTVELSGIKQQLEMYVLKSMTADYDAILGVDGLSCFSIVLDFQKNEACLNVSKKPVSSVVPVDKKSKMDFSLVDMGVADEVQRRQLMTLLEEYHDLFDEISPGSAKDVRHEIDVEPETRPIFQKPYAVPFSKKKIIADEVQKMLDAGVIQKSKSPWSSPIVLATKKDGSVRFCVDFKKLNQVTKKDKYPLPDIDQMLRQVQGAKYFTSLDLASGYWQIKLREEDREKTAFTTDEGHYEWIVMPFGLTNGPATFQRYIDEILKTIEQVKKLIDDILVFTKTWEQHLNVLRKVFEILRDSRVKLKLKKCHFLKPQVNWVGHVVDGDGIRVDPAKTVALERVPVPSNAKELRSFLGLANYYRKFVKNFAMIAAPLYNLTRKDVPWEWNPSTQQAFDSLKKSLMSTDVLVNPDFEKPYILYTDASDIGMGAVLTQNHGDEERPITYISQHFSPRERKYSTIEKEMAAIIWALDKLRLYLYGSHFSIKSDHRPLKWLLQKQNAVGRLGRWQCRLLEYEGLEDIEYLKGAENVVADFFSRSPEFLVSALGQEMSPEQLRRKQVVDPAFDKLRHSMTLVEGIWTYDSKTFIPQCLVPKILESFHGKGIHFGIQNTVQIIGQTLYWPTLRHDVEEFVKQCDICQVTKSTKNAPAPTQSLPIVCRPFERIALDYCGPFRLSNRNNKYILVAVDHFSRFIRIFPVPEATTTVSVDCLKQLMKEEGIPSQILTDRGTHFTGKVFEDFLKSKGIKHLLTSPYHPQCDGMVERNMRTIKNLLRADLLERSDMTTTTWDVNIPLVEEAMNQKVHPATGHTPFSLVRGRTSRIIRFPWMNLPTKVEQVLVPWTEIAQKNYQHLKISKDKGNRGKILREFQVGDKVWKLSETSSGLQPRYQGPYEIFEKYGRVNYKIGENSVGRKCTVHVDKLIPARRSPRIRLLPRPVGRGRR